VVRLLLERGARLGARDADGRTAEDLAALAARAPTAALLAAERERRGLLGRL
jgi:hypothetical protein